MYISYFGLNQSPFRTAPDPEYFFASGLHLRAVDRVVHAIRERDGLVLVLGEIGQGKTTVCRYVQTRYRDEFLIGYLGNPFLDVQEFGRQILLEFGLSGEVSGSGDVVRALSEFLREQDSKGRVVVLFLDEAHLLSPDVLEFLLIVTNIQHRGRHLLQMVLAGQNEFQETLRQPRFSSLNQRLGNRIAVTDFDRGEVRAYIRFRLDQSGGSGKEFFSPAAVTRIWKVTRGNPRLINQMSERLLERAYEQRVDRIGPKDVNRLCASPVFSPILFPTRRAAENVLAGPVILGTIVTVVLVGIASTLFYVKPSARISVSEITFSPENFPKALAGISQTIGLDGVESSGSGAMREPCDEILLAAGTVSSGREGSDAIKDGEAEIVSFSGFPGGVRHGADAGVDEKLEKILQLLATRQSEPGGSSEPGKAETVVVHKRSGFTPTERSQNLQPGTRTSGPDTGTKKPPRAEEEVNISRSIQTQERLSPVSEEDEPEIREAFLSPAPGIVVDAIVWDPIPRYRLAVVNERIVRRGDTAGKGCTVEAILKDRIRLSLSGRMFENRVHGNGKK
jgi:type II secretory pathway predicted ATPase ExeA